MIICSPRGVRHFIGDQDDDTNGLRYTIQLGSCAFVIKDASIHLTRQEESACASTQGPDCAIPSSWEAAPTHPNRPPGIAYGCEAYAGSCVLVTWTRGISATVDALAGSRPAQCPELNTDGGLLPLRRVQVIVGARCAGGRGAAHAAATCEPTPTHQELNTHPHMDAA